MIMAVAGSLYHPQMGLGCGSFIPVGAYRLMHVLQFQTIQNPPLSSLWPLGYETMYTSGNNSAPTAPTCAGGYKSGT